MLCNGVLACTVQETEPAVHTHASLCWAPSRSDTAEPSGPRALQQAPLRCPFHPWRVVSPTPAPDDSIRRGIRVCSLRPCLYFCSANKTTYKMAQTFQFSRHYTPAILFRVRMCRAFHLSWDSPSFSMEIVCIFVKFPTLHF